MSREPEVLFNTIELDAVTRSQESQMYKTVEAMGGNSFLNTPIDDLCDTLELKYGIEPLVLKETEVQVDQEDVNVDVSQDSGRAIYDRSRPFYIKGTRVSFFIPFDGEKELFGCCPSTRNFGPPRGIIGNNELILTYSVTGHNSEQVKEAFSRDLREVRQWLQWIANDLKPFNAGLRAKAKAAVETRREKLLKDQGLVSSLGFPLRRRDTVAPTFAAPVTRRKVSAQRAPAVNAPYKPEPTLDMAEYEHILSILSNMVLVMERSPGSFRGMKEEDLRTHFLVHLNGHYEGQATGETFNGAGRTDILIRVEAKNIFIAECKFWDGPQSLAEAIDQVLSYNSWRDTKTAIILFNRNKNLSAVLGRVPEVARAHQHFKRVVTCDSETGFRFSFSHNDDPNRELLLTVLAFDVPA